MKKTILLVNPWIYDFAAYDFWAKPLGLLYLASLLRQNDYDVRYVDCLDPFHPGMTSNYQIKPPKRKSSGAGKYSKETVAKPTPLQDIPKRYSRYGLTPRIFNNEISKLSRPDLILITSMMTYWYPGVFHVIALLRELLPGVPVILGGNYATLCHDHALQYSGADLIIPGEGEKSIEGLLREYLGDDIHFLPDLTDLDSYPYPAFDLIRHNDQVPLMTSRGCPFRCTYCASHLLNDGFRVREPIKVVDEIEYWNKRHGIKNFSFYDDALLVNAQDRAVPMLNEIIKRNIDGDFHCPNGLHIREITEELSILMFKARFRTVRFGFETSSIKRQIETGGKINNEQTRNAILHLRNAGYEPHEIGMYILCGLPGQTAEEVRQSILFIQSCGARPVIAEYSPIPHTPLWEEAVINSPFNVNDEPLYQNNTLLPCRSDALTYEMYRDLKMLTREI